MKKIIENYLRQAQNKRIKTRNIEDYVLNNMQERKYSYQQFATAIKELVNQNKLRPVKARGENGRRPRLYNWYQIKTEDKKISKELKKELLTQYAPQLSMSYYLHHPGQYKRDQEYIKIIDDFFKRADQTSEMAVNERSFQLFNDEKFLNSRQGQQILERLGIAVTDLNCYLTYEPFFYYRNQTDGGEKNILIIENKDTFFSIKKLLQEGITKWNGIEVSLLIYGEGKKIQSSFSFFKELDQYQAANLELNFYYFGDLDPEGIKIWWGLQNKYEVEFIPLKFFYQQLLKYSQAAVDLKTEQIFSEVAVDEFCDYFAKSAGDKIKHLLQNGKYLPQEGLSYQLLKVISCKDS
ncbi:Wadjet anti-phage system protein JetD domain-containing protein [Halanaerobacter jeridensis]|uniref:Wadjet protein JetD C-terminal domain-containing protein n=1 Tax=Halanaerobacter jeridensis TaxID=706427 RepID=A0A938XV37_9FIRM|nr:Wadjet anti-phage system protein JetD domain-containing protein [Halanaerobacter jeridensis]MBM7558093.1 hypothetical protein [Halanaerobacter jeridensis]